MEYFRHANRQLPPMPEDDGRYNDLISLWLAHCAALSYQSKYRVAEELKQAGFSRALFFEQGSTEAYIAHLPPTGESSGICVVAFRGTEKDYKDILSDVTFFKATIDYRRDFRAHGGFLAALNSVWGSYWRPEELNKDGFQAERYGTEGIVEKLMELRGPNDRLYFTGHSLGGAIANLAAYAYGRDCAEAPPPTAVYTIGAPRSADKPFVEHLRRHAQHPSYRVVNHADIVPAVPPWLLGFRHMGTCHYLTKKGDMKVEPGARLLIRNVLLGLVPLLSRITPFRWLKKFRVSAFYDHTSAEYVRKLGKLIPPL